MKVSELLKPEFVIPELKGETKEDIINELIDLFKNDPRIEDIEKVRSSVLDREKVMSTGVGKGFAIPHGKTNACLLYTSDAADERSSVDLGGRRIIKKKISTEKWVLQTSHNIR